MAEETMTCSWAGLPEGWSPPARGEANLRHPWVWIDREACYLASFFWGSTTSTFCTAGCPIILTS